MTQAAALSMRSRPTGELSLDNGTSVALAPVLSELRNASNTIEVIAILDVTPEHLFRDLIEVITMRPAMYRRDVIAEVLRIIGFARLKRLFGLTRAVNMIERFDTPSFV